MSAADDALRVIMDAIEIDTVAEAPAVHFTPVGLADLAGALADLIEAARAEGEAAGAARERAAVAAYLRHHDVVIEDRRALQSADMESRLVVVHVVPRDAAAAIEAGEHVGAAGGAA